MAFLAALNAIAAGPAPQPRPNIVFLFADDLGYGDLSCQNPGSKIATPNLDRLASQGIRFTDAHAPSALCTPSRYGLLTGQYCWRTRLKSGVLNMWDEPLIAPERVTVSSLLRDQGYRTGCFGKWHLGLSWPFVRTVPAGFDTGVTCRDIDWSQRIEGGPVDHGFDYYFGVNIVNHPPYAFLENDRVCGRPDTQYGTVTGEQSHWAGPGVSGWDWRRVMPAVTSNAVRWIQQSCTSNSPFFAYFAFTGPHQPVVPNAQFVGSSKAGAYGDFVRELDDAVGQVLKALDDSGAATNTVVIFTSDNGPDEFAYQRIQDYAHYSMGGLRGIKNDIWEGGHRIPFIARWPGRIAPASTSSHTICLVDFLRTTADLVGAAVPTNAAEDSVSFLPTLLGQPCPNRPPLILESACGQFGIRSNEWMYIDSYTGDGHNPELEPAWFKQSRGYPLTNTWPALLYNLQNDLREAANLYGQQTLIANQLRTRLQSARGESTWTGSHCTNWTCPLNWSPRAPGIGADVVYTNGAGFGRFSESLGADFSLDVFCVHAGLTNPITISPGGSFELKLLAGIDLSQADDAVTLQPEIRVEQSQEWTVKTNRTLTVTGGVVVSGQLEICGGGNVTVAGPISGDGQLFLRNGGVVRLSGANSFGGGARIAGGGALLAEADGALGVGPLTIPNNSTLQIKPGVILTNEAGISGTGRLCEGVSRGALSLQLPGAAHYNGPIRLFSDAALYAGDPQSVLTVGGTIDGAGALTVLPGQGTVVLAAANSYAGRTTVQGKLKLYGGDDRLPTSTSLYLGDSSTAAFQPNGCSQTVGSLAGGGRAGGSVLLGGGALTIQQAANTTYSGALCGTGKFVKAGDGTLILAGSNTFTGDFVVQAGRLVVNGSIAGPVCVTGGEFGGTGVVSAPVTINAGGILRAGLDSAVPGVLSISNSLLLTERSVTFLRIDGLGSKCDQLRVSGNVTFGGVLKLTNVAPGLIVPGQAFRLFTAGSVTGTFSGIQPEPGPGLTWRFDPACGIAKAVIIPNLVMAQIGPGALEFSWEGSGFHLKAQTNSAATGLNGNWYDYPGGGVSPVLVPIDLHQAAVFLRLVTP